jgi:hypothetical protein
MHGCEVRKVCNEKEVIEELYRASFRMLLVDDYVSATCSAVPSKCSCIIRTVECACVSISLLQICGVTRYDFEDIFIDRICEEG